MKYAAMRSRARSRADAYWVNKVPELARLGWSKFSGPRREGASGNSKNDDAISDRRLGLELGRRGRMDLSAIERLPADCSSTRTR